MIPRTKEFFISLKDHDEWGIAHTVWGEVRLDQLLDGAKSRPVCVNKNSLIGTPPPFHGHI
jgi:hypothetical protein